MSDTDTKPAVVENATAQLMRMATDAAGVCREIVTKTAVQIEGKKYVKVEGWMSIATAHGCVASARDVEETATGVRCIGEVRRIADGTVLATAEGFVGKDETSWYGGTVRRWDKVKREFYDKVLEKRPDYAIRAMCQTRAISRVCRTAFAHVVVLIDEQLSTTPAEEVPLGGFRDERGDAGSSEVKAPPSAHAITVPREGGTMQIPLPGGRWENVTIHFGKNKGVRLGDLEEKSLLWYANEWQPKPFNGKISDQDRMLRAALDAYLEEVDAGSASESSNREESNP